MDNVCAITYGNGMGTTASGASLFEACSRAIEWAEVDCKLFGTARRIPDAETSEPSRISASRTIKGGSNDFL